MGGMSIEAAPLCLSFPLASLPRLRHPSPSDPPDPVVGKVAQARVALSGSRLARRRYGRGSQHPPMGSRFWLNRIHIGQEVSMCGVDKPLFSRRTMLRGLGASSLLVVAGCSTNPQLG